VTWFAVPICFVDQVFCGRFPAPVGRFPAVGRSSLTRFPAVGLCGRSVAWFVWIHRHRRSVARLPAYAENLILAAQN
jgi:hypothetical protein